MVRRLCVDQSFVVKMSFDESVSGLLAQEEKMSRAFTKVSVCGFFFCVVAVQKGNSIVSLRIYVQFFISC